MNGEQPETNGRNERLARLENSVANLTGVVTSLAAKVDALADARKTPWNTLGTWAGVLMTMVLAVAGLSQFVTSNQIESVRQMAVSQSHLAEAQQTTANERISLLRSGHDSMVATVTARLAHVEAQMHAQSNYRNLEIENLHRLTGQLWLETFKKPLGGKIVYPIQGSDTSQGQER